MRARTSFEKVLEAGATRAPAPRHVRTTCSSRERRTRHGTHPHADTRGRRPGFPQLQRGLPLRRAVRRGRIHGGSDPEHLGPSVPTGSCRTVVPGRHPDLPRRRAGRHRRTFRGQAGRLLVQRRVVRLRHAQGRHRQRGGCGLRAPRATSDDAGEPHAGDRGVCRADRRGQESDQPAHRAAAARARPAGSGRAASDALRRLVRPTGATLRHDGGCGAPGVHDRRDRRVRAAHRQWICRVRRRGLRRHSGARGIGRRCDRLGRREQRPALLPAGAPHRRGRPACGWATS